MNKILKMALWLVGLSIGVVVVFMIAFALATSDFILLMHNGIEHDVKVLSATLNGNDLLKKDEIIEPGRMITLAYWPMVFKTGDVILNVIFSTTGQSDAIKNTSCKIKTNILRHCEAEITINEQGLYCTPCLIVN